MKALRTILLTALSFVLLISSVSSVSASQNNRLECAHSWTLVEYAPIYLDNGSNHTAYVFRDYICSKCGLIETAEPLYWYESHLYNIYEYTNNNYHSGTRHYFEYRVKCICGHQSSGTVWKSGYCSGGSHISPLSVLPADEHE